MTKAIDWANSTDATPDFVRNVILNLQQAQQKGEQGEAAAKRAVDALARAMGLIPSSEKTPKVKVAKPVPLTDDDLEDLQASEKDIKSLLRYVSRQHKKIQKQIKEAFKRQSEKKAETEESKNSGPLEPIMGGVTGGSRECADEELYPDKGVKEDMGPETIATRIRRTKNDLILCRRDPTLNMEKLYNPKSGVTLYPDTSLVGPKGFQVTWRALANVIVLAFGMAVPLSRIEKLFGKKGFSRSNTASYCAYVAERLFGVYIAMSEELANCEVLMGDDCVSRISDLTRYRRDLRIWQRELKNQNDKEAWLKDNPEPQRPWDKLGAESLTKKLQQELDFEFAYTKANSSSLKIRLHTSVLSGQTIVGNPQSRVILYRSHLGSVGNLASRILLSRTSSNKDLVFVGDLSPSNHITDPEILKHVKITYAGCSSHARRPFKRHLDNDPENCLDALDHFRALYQMEDIITNRNPSRLSELRADTENGSMAFWNDLKKICEDMLDKWSPSTALGEGIRYVISNFNALTLYCRDTRLPISNDLSERLLRFEKLMDRSSFGRETIEGRARYDIIRSFYQSALFAGIDPTFALLEVLITSPEIVAASPEKYTPQAIAARLKIDPERCTLLDTILTTSKFAPLVTFRKSDPNVPIADDDV